MNYHRDVDDDQPNEDIPMQPKVVVGRPKFRNTLEAQIQKDDTLQAIAIRYNCSVSERFAPARISYLKIKCLQVADIKSLNKIERDFEIHARRTLKVPLTADTALIAPLPIVHKSGQSSPNHSDTSSMLPDLPNPNLNEMLMVAAVSTSPSLPILTAKFPIEPSINDIILNTQITSNTYTDNVPFVDDGKQYDLKCHILFLNFHL